MPRPSKPEPFVLSEIDRIAFDPENGAANDLNWWAKLYFDGMAFPWQQYWYHYPCKDKLVIAGIRTGKTRAAAMGMLHLGMYHPHIKGLNVSISLEQSKLVYYAMREMLETPYLEHWVEDIQRSPYPVILLKNGSKFDFRSVGYEAELLRGDQWDVINLDEAAYITSDVAVNTIRGRLLGFNTRRGEPLMGLLWQGTTPKGKTSWLFRRWKRGDSRYEGSDPAKYLSLRALTTDNTLLDEEMIREIMEQYTDREIQQEFQGIFLDASDTEFSLEQLTYCCNSADPVVAEIEKGIERWNESRGKHGSMRKNLGLAEDIEHYEIDPLPGRQYICSWDLGKKVTKKGRNATVGMAWDITEVPWRMVAFRYEPGIQYLQAMGYIEEWQTKYSSRGTKAFSVIDATGKGDVLNEIIEAENRIQVEGIVYSNIMKPNLITAGKIVVERAMIRFPGIRRMLDQMSMYTQVDQGIPQDIVMAFCQAAYKARELTGVTMARSTIPIQSTVFRRQRMGMNPLMQRAASRRRGPRSAREFSR